MLSKALFRGFILRWRIALPAALFGLAASLCGAQVRVLHAFGGADDGAFPGSSLVYDGTAVYGTTPYGGNASLGTLFQFDRGGNYSVLRHGAIAGFIEPWGAPSVAGGTLCAATRYGGALSTGTLFLIGVDGGGFGLAHSFAGPPADGNDAWSDLTFANGTLYSAAAGGGAYGNGTLFKIDEGGGGYATLYQFNGGDGAQPRGAPAAWGGALYGMASRGGSAGQGVIYRVNTDGTSLTLLHHFAGGPGDGAQPWGGLTPVGTAFYGMTLFGGAWGQGAICRINADGTSYTLLHSFGGSAADGAQPCGGLAFVEGWLFGFTSAGGEAGCGTLFRIGLDGGNYAVVHALGGAADGAAPRGTPLPAGNALWGTASAGGPNGRGTLFAWPLPASGARHSNLYSFASGARLRGEVKP